MQRQPDGVNIQSNLDQRNVRIEKYSSVMKVGKM